jgi:hypothetical protein
LSYFITDRGYRLNWDSYPRPLMPKSIMLDYWQHEEVWCPLLTSDLSLLHLTPFIIISILVFVCGAIAVNRIQKHHMKGIGLAITGLLSASLMLIPLLIFLLFFVAVGIHAIPSD